MLPWILEGLRIKEYYEIFALVVNNGLLLANGLC